MRWTLMFLLGLASSCGRSTPAAPTPAPTPAPTAPSKNDPACGVRPDDWCAAPAGDPCGAHKDKASCLADAACAGLQYRGESVVACHFDARGFADNCPTVGCISIAAK
jgi:hypothetical protein